MRILKNCSPPLAPAPAGYHLPVGFDGLYAHFYVDGNLENSRSPPGPAVWSDKQHTVRDLIFGTNCDLWGKTHPFRTSVVDIRLYNEALAQAPIAQLLVSNPEPKVLVHTV